MCRNGSARIAGAAATNDNGHLVLMAESYDGRDLVARARHDDQIRPMRQVQGVGAVDVE
jgi:hypothetical protein